MTTFNKLVSSSTMKKTAPLQEEVRPLSEAADRIAANVREITQPNRLEKRASVEKIHACGGAIRRDLDVIAEIVAGLGPFLAKRNADARRNFLCGRQIPPLDVNDPRALEIIGDAIRANPGLLDKFNRPN